MAIHVTSEASKYSPKIRITDEVIEFKLGFFQANNIVLWNDVRSIVMKSYGIVLRLAESQQYIKYKSSPEISKKVKEIIREVAGQKGIELEEA